MNSHQVSRAVCFFKNTIHPELSNTRFRRIINRNLVIIAILTLIGAALRLWLLNRLPPGLYQEEAFNGNEALSAWRTGHFRWFYPTNNGREGLFINLQASALAIFGAHVWVLRVVSAFFGIFTIPAIYLLTLELFNGSDEKSRRTARTSAFLAAFFLATGFSHLVFSRIGLRPITSPFFFVGPYGCCLRH